MTGKLSTQSFTTVPFQIDAQNFLLFPETAEIYDIKAIHPRVEPNAPTDKPIKIRSRTDSPHYKVDRLIQQIETLGDNKTVIGTARAEEIVSDLSHFGGECFLSEQAQYPGSKIDSALKRLCQVLTDPILEACRIENLASMDGHELNGLQMRINLSYRFVKRFQLTPQTDQLKEAAYLVSCLLDYQNMDFLWPLSMAELGILIGDLHEMRTHYKNSGDEEGYNIVEKNIAIANKTISFKSPLDAFRRSLI